ncbi:MAG: HAD hydrolase-like protein, partial [Oscillospiraceae bacterium]|nr:HAD hydrolase-like protein [Oscillospiraceae bacterium]
YASKTEIVREITAPDAHAVVIGDTHGDISAASENGLRSIAALYGYGNKSMLEHADYFANMPEEIVGCVCLCC